jgi:L-2-hydroxycarboxylate dehydrogenase (NAD+)
VPVGLRARELSDFIAAIFVAMGAPPDDAPIIADAYVTADMYGLASHGVMRVLRIQDGIDAGTHVPANRPTIVRESEATALVDGNSALGVGVGVFGMRLAIEKARDVGIGCVGVFNSNHFGMAGYYVRMAAAEQMVGFTFCNSAPGIAAFGGTRAILGTNPVAIGAPTSGMPFALDLSPASVVRGKALEAQRRGEQLPEGTAVDREGNPTTDPTEALDGAFLPYGGPQAYKTFGLALMIDVLCGPLVGAAFGDRVTGSADTTVDCNKGDVYIAIDIKRFRDLDGFLADMDELAAMVKASGEGVMLPGEPEHARVEAANGTLVLDDDLGVRLVELGKRYGVAVPRAMTQS